MRKIVSIVVSLALVCALTSCGTNGIGEDNVVNNEISTVVKVENSDAVQWKQFLKEYEEWVDSYIEITKKYKSNPSDLSILSNYTKMMTELADWATKTADMEKELENASSKELTEYSVELARIAAKIAQAAK